MGAAFGYVFRSPNWFGKILIGAVCLIFSFLILPSLILTGYQVAAARNVSRGQNDLPPWDNLGQKLLDGLLLAVSFFVWAIPAYVLYFIALIVGGCSTTGGQTHCGNAGAASLIFVICGLYVILLALLSPSIWAEFLAGGIGAALQFGKVFARTTANIGPSILVLLMLILTGIIAFIGIVAIFVGLLLTVPYALFVQAGLYGQYAKASA